MNTQKTLAKAIGAAAIALSGTASAALFMPPADTALYIKFSNKEQICLPDSNGAGTNCITPPTTTPGYKLPSGLGATEQNWGVMVVSSVFAADPASIAVNPYAYSQSNTPLFSGSSTQQITGIFYGIQAYDTPNNPISSTSGYLDLWYQDSSMSGFTEGLLSQGPTDRTSANEFKNFTDGVFLGRIAYAPGIDAVGNPNVNIVGDTKPTSGVFHGLANSYGDVIDVDGIAGIDAGDGAWAQFLNGNYFPVDIDYDSNGSKETREYRDFRFANRYDSADEWNGADATRIRGAVSDDPARVYVVPEPGSLALMGLGLVGAGLISRRRK